MKHPIGMIIHLCIDRYAYVSKVIENINQNRKMLICFFQFVIKEKTRSENGKNCDRKRFSKAKSRPN